MSNTALNLSAFGRVKFTNPDGTLTREAVRALQTVQQILGGASGVIYASTVANVPAGGISSTNVQDAINELDGEKQPKDPTLTGFALLAVTANTIPYGTGSDTFGLLTLDADGTLAANSDTHLTTQKAIKTYADTKVPQTRTVNGHALSADVTITASDVGAISPPSGTAILKANSDGPLANAVAGTDYVAPGGALGTPSSGNLANCDGLPLGSGVTGNLPISQGGTGKTSLAFTTYTPTASPTSGTITTLGAVAGRYFQFGKAVFVQLQIPITTNGTGSGALQASLSIGVGSFDYFGSGRAQVSGKGLAVQFMAGTSTVRFTNYDGTYPGADGETVEVSGWYESV